MSPIRKKMFDCLVIGAGVQGLFAAYYLSARNNIKVALLDQFEIGHTNGSSHGASRIIRSIYPNQIYIDLLQLTKKVGWDIIEKKCKRQLVYPNSACYFGSGKAFDQYTETSLKSGLDIQLLDVKAAREQYPQFSFPNLQTVIKDNTSSVIAAKDVIDYLLEEILKNGVHLFEKTKVLKIDFEKDPIKINTNQGDFFTERLVITAGPWVKKLVPELREKVTPIKQTVAYFKLEGRTALYKRGLFPNWASIKDSENDIFYGLPIFNSEGIKVSQHLTHGVENDPDNQEKEINSNQLNKLTEFVEYNFRSPIEKFIGSETCFYTNTPNEDFIIDCLPSDERIAIGSACSGHGFKFAPLVGKILTELVFNGQTSFAEFEASRDLFSIKSN
ncbi:MAG: Monomeric sarcosine oxidase [Chlamydiales bacterium]|nr:Monomeric sarcosine oxidase [Chlamydiales bacterium]MCH9619280.1 Monomeric sarcosine oxidase [Chlamydiales bacterium]MCH9622542.1 Monomeric sarcosine oxidase [Chlamydiales bacterium]